MKYHKELKLPIVRDIDKIEKCYQDEAGYIRGNIYIPPENEKPEFCKWLEKIFLI